MPERFEKLRATLAELENELDSLESVDPETQAMLEEAVREIQAALHRDEAMNLEPDSLIARLKVTAQEFEADHPTVASVLTRVIDALGQMGI
jgi:septal ring factor EnvC (AmiA/AmiB activator)